MIQINTHNGMPIYRQIIEQIRREILSGGLAAGERLTSVRELSADLRVNPMTVSKAYSMMESEGILERRRGIGLFVAEMARTDRKQHRLELLTSTLREAAAVALQLGVSEDEATQQFRQCLRRVARKGRDR